MAVSTDISFKSAMALLFSIRSSQAAAFPTFAAKRKEVLNVSSQEDLVPN